MFGEQTFAQLRTGFTLHLLSDPHPLDPFFESGVGVRWGRRRAPSKSGVRESGGCRGPEGGGGGVWGEMGGNGWVESVERRTPVTAVTGK